MLTQKSMVRSLIKRRLSHIIKKTSVYRDGKDGAPGTSDMDPWQWLEHVLVEIPVSRKSGQPMDDLLHIEYVRCLAMESSISLLTKPRQISAKQREEA